MVVLYATKDIVTVTQSSTVVLLGGKISSFDTHFRATHNLLQNASLSIKPPLQVYVADSRKILNLATSKHVFW